MLVQVVLYPGRLAGSTNGGGKGRGGMGQQWCGVLGGQGVKEGWGKRVKSGVEW